MGLGKVWAACQSRDFRMQKYLVGFTHLGCMFSLEWVCLQVVVLSYAQHTTFAVEDGGSDGVLSQALVHQPRTYLRASGAPMPSVLTP